MRASRASPDRAPGAQARCRVASMRPNPDPAELASPLEDAWQPVIDTVLTRLGAPRTGEVARLAPKIAELSRAYNAGEAGADAATARRELPLEARVAFSFARDVPKAAAAVRELVASGVLTLGEDAPLRVLDVGAGLGAMTWGLARALSAAGAKGRIEALLVDVDARALDAATSVAAAVAEHPGAAPKDVAVSITTRTVRLGSGKTPLPIADVVLAGQVLSELDTSLDPAARVERHAAMLLELLKSSVAPGGSLVVVEPALRDRTRHLHAVRDRVLEKGGATLFAPCLHANVCPALANEGDWCHEDVAVDLPRWVAPLARAAGLRWQGLTFSYLVLRRDAERLVDRVEGGGLRLRVVSDLLRTKGKAEVFACTDRGRRLRIRRLDRDERSVPTRWAELRRGDVVTVTGEVDEKGRIAPDVKIDVWPSRQ
jgi:ribosomal protein RSM22 (predicted rRNA methylase)